MKRGCFLRFVGVIIKGSVQRNKYLPLNDVNCDKNKILCHRKLVEMVGLLYTCPITLDNGYWPPSILLSKVEGKVKFIFCDSNKDKLAAMIFRLKRGCIGIFHCCVGDIGSHSSYCN